MRSRTLAAGACAEAMAEKGRYDPRIPRAEYWGSVFYSCSQ